MRPATNVTDTALALQSTSVDKPSSGFNWSDWGIGIGTGIGLALLLGIAFLIGENSCATARSLPRFASAERIEQAHRAC